MVCELAPRYGYAAVILGIWSLSVTHEMILKSVALSWQWRDEIRLLMQVGVNVRSDISKVRETICTIVKTAQIS